MDRRSAITVDVFIIIRLMKVTLILVIVRLFINSGYAQVVALYLCSSHCSWTSTWFWDEDILLTLLYVFFERSLLIYKIVHINFMALCYRVRIVIFAHLSLLYAFLLLWTAKREIAQFYGLLYKHKAIVWLQSLLNRAHGGLALSCIFDAWLV